MEAIMNVTYILGALAFVALLLVLSGCSNAAPLVLPNPSTSESGDGFPSNGLDKGEATEFIEFCVDLDSQDDRLKPGYDKNLDPKFGADWSSIKDSRTLVADDAVATGKLHLPPPKNDDSDCEVPASDKDKIEKDPRCNGFGPFQNAWVLYKSNKVENTYALAIRGTVMGSKRNVVEDLLATTISASSGLRLEGRDPVRFASLSSAEVHGGFAYATFSMLFDNDFGAMRYLDKLPQGAKLYIVGHSQGAAMATLTHALLHYGMEDNLAELKPGRFKLKSYGYAQPKPGNVDFANDFMNITFPHGSAVVINNDIDPVPKVPFTFELDSDWDSDIGGSESWLKFIKSIAGAGKTLRSGFSSAMQDKIDKLVKGEKLDYFGKAKFAKFTGGASVNYASAGLIIPLRGDVDALVTKKADSFYQHHATTYRDLLVQIPK
jgi:hypothetical protein